jgi:putative ABC transport system permease protein
MLTDLRLGLRLFLRRPVIAFASVLSLALGIGANTAIFSVLHRVVLNPLPYEDPDRLVMIWETGGDNRERPVAPANFVDWRRETRSFASLAAFDEFSPALSGDRETERLSAISASGTFFQTLGASAALGRTLLPSDDEPGAASVAVLSDGLWHRLFGAAPDVLGRTLTLDGRAHIVVGVMPTGFETPLQATAELWVSGDRGVPRTFPFGGDVTVVRDSHYISVVGRLAREIPRETAQHELMRLMEELARRHPDSNAGLGVNVKPLHEAIIGNVRALVALLQLAVVMLLLIACANVAHLLLGHAAGRHNEMSTRLALGAGRGRVIRQVLAETLVIAVPGGVLGLVLAFSGLGLLVAAAPAALPRVREIGIDPVVLAFTSTVTLLAAFVFGIAPALHLARRDSSAQSQAATRVTAGGGVRRWHHAIVVAELALAQVLLIGAGLLLTSFAASQSVPLGFSTEGRVAADLSLLPGRYLQPREGRTFAADPAMKLSFVDAVIERLQGQPGVRAAAASFTSPLAGPPNRGISIAGRPRRGTQHEHAADFQLVTPDYFRAIGTAIVLGRGITAADRGDSVHIAVVNQTFVDRYFPGQDPIGARLLFGGNRSHEIVGVVGDMRFRRVESPADPTFYIPITQNDERWPFLSFTVWMDDPRAGASLVRDTVRAVDPAQPVTRVRSFDEIVAAALAPRRFNTVLVSSFAAAALLLAALGIYGVMSYAVSMRARELGLRAALGAGPAVLVRLVVGQGAALTAMAVVLGVSAGLALAGLLGTMLYNVAPRDARVFTTVGLLLVAVAMAATYFPARRAVHIDPISALRDQ